MILRADTILDAELIAIFVGPLAGCCIALLASGKLGRLRFGIYVFIAVWSVPLSAFGAVEISVVVFYLQHYAQLQNAAMSRFAMAGWMVVYPFLNGEPHIRLWLIIPCECTSFFIFSAGWRWLSRKRELSTLAA